MDTWPSSPAARTRRSAMAANIGDISSPINIAFELAANAKLPTPANGLYIVPTTAPIK